MLLKCCVGGCNATNETHRLFVFPKKDTLRNLWMSFLVPTNPLLLGLTTEQLLRKRVCVKHFDKYQFDGEGKRLRYSYPCLFTDDEITHGEPLAAVGTVQYALSDHNYFKDQNDEEDTMDQTLVIGRQGKDFNEHLSYLYSQVEASVPQNKGTAPLAKFLKKTAVPSIFCFTKMKQETPEALARQQRCEKRSQRKLFQDSEQVLTEPVLSNFIPDIGQEEEVCTINESTQITSTEPECLSISTQIDHEHVYGSINRYKNDDKAILFYTGFETYKKFYLVYSTLSPMTNKIRYFGSNVTTLPTEDQFFLTMMKLRQNKCIFELSRFFNVSETTVSNIFITWINFIYQLWSRINIWPRKDLIQYYMPQHFKEYDGNVRVILDATEIAVQKPKNPTSQQASWSSYKHANTLKVLVGATPGGLLSYCSQAYAGSISDRQTVERSDLLSKCQSGDSILADRGFTIQDMFADKNITVKIPSFLKGKSQLPGLTIIKDRELASKRVHIERIIGLTKTYKILKSELDHSYVPIASKIFFVCFMCCNFRECIMKKNK